MLKEYAKRLVWVLVTSLGFGLMGTLPSSAVVAAHTLTIDSGTDSIVLGESATAVLTHSFVNLDASDSVTLNAIVTSSNAASAGVLMMSVTDSYTSAGNDATSANSPRYTFGGSQYIDSVSSAAALSADTGTIANARRGTDFYMVRDASNWFLTSNYSGGSTPTARDSLSILGGASDSTTVSPTAGRSIGSQIELKLYNPTSAGTYTITVFSRVSNNGAALVSATTSVTWTVTVTAPSKSATADSTVTSRQGQASSGLTYYNGTADGTDSQTLAAATATATDVTAEFSLVVNQKNGTSTNTAQESFTVTVSGEAWISASATTFTTRMVAGDAAAVKTMTFAYPTAGTPVVVHVWSTGVAGTATLTTATTSGLTLGTDTFTFHGDVTTLAIGTVYKSVLQAGTASAISDVVTITAKDAGARAVTGLSVGIVSSDATQISTGSCTDNLGLAGATTAVTDGTYLCSVTPVVSSASGKAVTLTIRTADPASTTGAYLTTTHAVTMGGAVSTVVLTLDKATYEPGEVMTITATAKDSSGNTPYDGQSGPTLTSNKQLGASISMSTYRGGNSISNTRSSSGVVSNTTNLFAPAAAGKFTINGRDGQTTPAEISVSATVADDAATAAANAASDAAAEAIDAANAATDAANLAAEAADAATVAAEEARDAADAATAAVAELAAQFAALVASVKAQITTLANTVAKIAKKVKA
jgi:hypothetical protein